MLTLFKMKKKIQNIKPKYGLSRDFKIAFGNLSNYLERVRDGESARSRHLAKRSFLHRAIPKYEEYFDPDIYENVITNFNSENIFKINSLINQVNEMRATENTDFAKLSLLEQELFEMLT